MACPGYEVNVLTGDPRTSPRRCRQAVTPAMTDAQAREASAGRDRRDRDRVQHAHEAALRRRHAVPGRRVPAVPATKQVHRRAPRLRARAAIAFFGGDPDNFTFPRHDVDICVMRAYENGKPATPPSYLRWTTKGTSEGDLVFVSGHPGSTSRMETMARLEYLRDRPGRFGWTQLKRRIRVLQRVRGPRRRAAAPRARPDLRLRELGEGRERILRRAAR